MRTKFDPNEVVIYGDYAEIVMYDKYNEEKGRAVVDTVSLPLLTQYKWSMDKDGYARSMSSGKETKMHRLLTGAPPDKVVDHGDRDKLNNRLYNLTVTNQHKNLINTGMFSNNTSGHKGVTWDKNKGKWAARLKYMGKTINLGRFDDINDAVEARKQGELKYWSD